MLSNVYLWLDDFPKMYFKVVALCLYLITIVNLSYVLGGRKFLDWCNSQNPECIIYNIYFKSNFTIFFFHYLVY